ncbi:MAG: hypothetical protein QM756_27810 [Polyangiaceae bacterium]
MRISVRAASSSVVLACLGLSLPACVGPPSGARGAAKSASSTSSGSSSGDKPKSETYVWKNVVMLGGGFVTGVIFSPLERDLVYVRTDVGGAYRLDPKDKSWLPITDMFGREDAAFLGIESLAADPVDANKVYMAVGMYSASWANVGAILRSSDRGASWQRTDMTIKMGGNENARSNGERLAVDPNKPDVLYFGSRRNGLWKSTDGAVSFSQVASFPMQSDEQGLGVLFVTFDRKSGSAGSPSKTIYAGLAKTDGCLIVSNDGGETWKPVPKQPTGLMASHAEFDSNGILYLSYGNVPGPSDVVNGAVYKFNPKGNEWTNISPVEPGKVEKDKFGYGGLSVDAKNPGTLVVSTIDRWTHGDDIFRSTDGGKKWTTVGSKAEHDPAGARYLYWDHDKPSSSGWMGDIDIDPFDPGHVYYVTGQGILGRDRRHRDRVGQACALQLPKPRAGRGGGGHDGEPTEGAAARERCARLGRLPSRRSERCAQPRHVPKPDLLERLEHRVRRERARNHGACRRAGSEEARRLLARQRRHLDPVRQRARGR